MKKTCLIICYTDLASDPRVIKHFEALKNDFTIVTAGVSPVGGEQRFIKIKDYSLWEDLNNRAQNHKLARPLFSIPLKALNFLRFKVFRSFYFLRYWNVRRLYDFLRLARIGHVDLIVANDINTLPLAVALAGRHTRLVYDAHEYHTEEHAERELWVLYSKPFLQFLYRRYLHRANACITVGENIAKRYETDYGQPFYVVHNTSPYLQIAPSQTTGNRLRLVYSGMYGKNRNLHELIRTMDHLPERYELNLLLTDTDLQLKKLIETSRAKDRIFVHAPVPVKQVASFINKFDIGIHLMADLNFNNDNALPNKYFQYIQARLVTAFGPLNEIKTYTNAYQTGIICKGFTGQDLAEALLKLTVEEINRTKENNNTNARIFCEENEVLKLKNVYEQVMA